MGRNARVHARYSASLHRRPASRIPVLSLGRENLERSPSVADSSERATIMDRATIVAVGLSENQSLAHGGQSRQARTSRIAFRQTAPNPRRRAEDQRIW